MLLGIARLGDTWAKNEISIARLSEQVNLSQKQLERVFTRTVGLTPKRYSRLARFQKIVSFLERREGFSDWTSLALEFGFFDHSHMVKDFQAFAGTAPGRFADATAGIVEIVYSDAKKRQDV